MTWNTFEIRDGRRLGAHVDGDDGWYVESDGEVRDVDGPFDSRDEAEAEADERNSED